VDESAEDEQRKSYAILLSDTVIVPESGKAPEVLTLGVPKDWRDIAYYLKVCKFFEIVDVRLYSDFKMPFCV
jgi:nucleosome binding factor SPN SPT16 subunit